MPLPVLGLAALPKSLIRIRGPDAAKFLNGLITTRLLPNVIKKKQHTISENENRHAELQNTIDLAQNWGLMHEDIYDPENRIFIRRDGLNSMLLNSKGRVETDCFLYSDPFHNSSSTAASSEEPAYLVEVDSRMATKLLLLLKLHKLSAKVRIEQTALYSYYYYNDTPEFDDWLESVQDEFFSTFDPANALNNANSFIRKNVLFNSDFASHIRGFSFDNRIPNFGVKFVSDREISTESIPERLLLENVFAASFQNTFAVDLVSEEVLTQRRFLNGLFEVFDIPKQSSLLPFETNLDFTNGLSLEKGCYVGQELTIRTYNNGIIRKRIFPVQFFDLEDSVLECVSGQEQLEWDPADPVAEKMESLDRALDLLNVTPLVEEEVEDTTSAASPFGSSKPVRRRKTSSGKILASKGNLGFVLAATADVEKNALYKVELGNGSGSTHIGMRVFWPEWWPEVD